MSSRPHVGNTNSAEARSASTGGGLQRAPAAGSARRPRHHECDQGPECRCQQNAVKDPACRRDVTGGILSKWDMAIQGLRPSAVHVLPPAHDGAGN
jgi:hypothetical protein